jgi:hypothetical protein
MKNLKDVGKRGFEPPFCALASLTSLQGLCWVYPAARPKQSEYLPQCFIIYAF